MHDQYRTTYCTFNVYDDNYFFGRDPSGGGRRGEGRVEGRGGWGLVEVGGLTENKIWKFFRLGVRCLISDHMRTVSLFVVG